MLVILTILPLLQSFIKLANSSASLICKPKIPSAESCTDCLSIARAEDGNEVNALFTKPIGLLLNSISLSFIREIII